MKPDDFEKELEGMRKPDMNLPRHERKLRLTLLSARRSVWWGMVLIILPALFVAINILNELGLGIPYRVFVPIYDGLERVHVFGVSLTPIIFLGGLFVAFILNVLSVFHISFTNSPVEFGLEIFVKKKWWNIVILLIVVGTVFVLGAYLIAENIRFYEPHDL